MHPRVPQYAETFASVSRINNPVELTRQCFWKWHFWLLSDTVFFQRFSPALFWLLLSCQESQQLRFTDVLIWIRRIWSAHLQRSPPGGKICMLIEFPRYVECWTYNESGAWHKSTCQKGILTDFVHVFFRDPLDCILNVKQPFGYPICLLEVLYCVTEDG